MQKALVAQGTRVDQEIVALIRDQAMRDDGALSNEAILDTVEGSLERSTHLGKMVGVRIL